MVMDVFSGSLHRRQSLDNAFHQVPVIKRTHPRLRQLKIIEEEHHLDMRFFATSEDKPY